MVLLKKKKERNLSIVYSYRDKLVFVFSNLFLFIYLFILYLLKFESFMFFKNSTVPLKKKLFTLIDNFVIYIKNEIFKNFIMKM